MSGVALPLAFSDDHVRSLIPLKFHPSSGLRAHRFRVLLPDHVLLPDPSSGVLFCTRSNDIDGAPVGLSRKIRPRAFEALRLISGVDGETSRVERYLAVHSAYETVGVVRDADLSAIRHALAHPAAFLDNPTTVASLQRRFGTTFIDLRKYCHQKEFYRCLAAMLIAVDEAVFTLISNDDRAA